VVGAKRTTHGWSETTTSQLGHTRPQPTWGEFAIKALAVIATRPSVRPGMTSPLAQVCIQFLSFERYLLERASAPPVRTSTPRSTGSELRYASTTSAKALTVRLMRNGLERLDLDAKNTKADDGDRQSPAVVMWLPRQKSSGGFAPWGIADSCVFRVLASIFRPNHIYLQASSRHSLRIVVAQKRFHTYSAVLCLIGPDNDRLAGGRPTEPP